MNHRASLFVILAFTLVTFLPDATAQQHFRIAGVVVDLVSGAPIERAEVTIAPVSNLDESSATLSASNGQFFFDGLAPGKYRLLASRSGYTEQGLDQHESYMTAVAVGPKLDSEHIRFRLFHESVISGNISDESGEPVRDAELFLFRRGLSGGASGTQLAGRSTTDDLGDYRIPHLAPGTYFIVAYAKPWYGPGLNAVGLTSIADSVETRGAFNRLRTRDRLVSADPSDSDGPQPKAQLEPPLQPARDVVYPLAFYSNAGSLESSTPLTLTPGASVTADFSLHPIPALHLLVKDPLLVAGNHFGEVAVTSASTGVFRFGATLQVAGVDLDQFVAHPSAQMPGFYEVQNAAPGEIAFSTLARADNIFSNQTILRQVSSDNPIDLVSSALVSVTGAVDSIPRSLHISAPDSQAQLSLLLTAADGQARFTSQFAKTGEFSLAVPAGKYTVSLIPHQFAHVVSLQATGAQASGNSLTLIAGSSVKLHIQIAQASATVSGVALKNGRPCVGAMLVLVPEDPTQSAALFHRDQSDSDGTFTMSPVFPGRYTLLAIENGWDLEWSKLSVLFPYLPAGLPVDIKPDASISVSAKVQ